MFIQLARRAGWFLFGLSIIGLPVAANAGKVITLTHCVEWSTGAGYCRGNMRSFREHADPQAEAGFSMWALSNGTVLRQFWANLGGSTYYCNADAAPIRYRWSEALAANGYFQVSWNTSSNCTALILDNNSAHR